MRRKIQISDEKLLICWGVCRVLLTFSKARRDLFLGGAKARGPAPTSIVKGFLSQLSEASCDDPPPLDPLHLSWKPLDHPSGPHPPTFPGRLPGPPPGPPPWSPGGGSRDLKNSSKNSSGKFVEKIVKKCVEKFVEKFVKKFVKKFVEKFVGKIRSEFSFSENSSRKFVQGLRGA